MIDDDIDFLLIKDDLQISIDPRYEAIREKARLYITKEITAPLDCLVVESDGQETTIGTLGNISMVTGIAKSKKTFVVSAFAAAVISNQSILKFKSKLPPDSKVLYIDTEQGPTQTRKVLKRILEMASLPIDKESDKIEFLCLRPYNTGERLKIIDYCVNHSDKKLKVLIIDGARDLVTNINDPSEATNIANYLLKWSGELCIHIMIVVHQNKLDKNVRGHLGSEMTNKAETVISVESVEGSEVSEIKGLYTRDRNFEPFNIMVNEFGFPELTDKRPLKIKGFARLDLQVKINFINTIFNFEISKLSKSQLWKLIKLRAPVQWKLSDQGCKDFVDHLVDIRILENLTPEKKEMTLILAQNKADAVIIDSNQYIG